MPPKKQAAVFQPSGDASRIVSLNQGTWAYVFDEKGKKHHVKRSSIAMVEICRSVDKALNGKIRLELEALGWYDVIRRMDEVQEDA
jgi:hypothetical protein